MGATAFATLGALLADRTRAAVLAALMDGRARTAGELSTHAQVAPSTMSEHLARLVSAGVVDVAAQGRHRYFRIARDEVGMLLEAIGGLDLPTPPAQAVHAPDELRFARSCYDHLAGQLAVGIHRRLVDDGHLAESADGLRPTEAGREFFARIGVPLTAGRSARPVARPCLDWTERRDHLGGVAGAGLFTVLLERRWVVHGRRPRSVRMTEAGRRGLGELFGPQLVSA